MNDGNRQQFKIEDEEGYVDQQIKADILELRRKIDERDDQLPVMVGSGEISQAQAVSIHYRTVKQYIRRIEPLLKSDDIDGAEEAYHNVPLGELEIVPPPVEVTTPGRFVSEEEITVKRMFANSDPDIKLAPASNVPLPKTKPVRGLKEIVEKDHKTAEWRVEAQEIEGQELPTFGDGGEEITISNNRPFGESILSNAVRAADLFLFNSGIGLEIGHPEKDDSDDNPF